MAILKNESGLGPLKIKNSKLSIKSKSINNWEKKNQDIQFVKDRFQKQNNQGIF